MDWKILLFLACSTFLPTVFMKSILRDDDYNESDTDLLAEESKSFATASASSFAGGFGFDQPAHCDPHSYYGHLLHHPPPHQPHHPPVHHQHPHHPHSHHPPPHHPSPRHPYQPDHPHPHHPPPYHLHAHHPPPHRPHPHHPPPHHLPPHQPLPFGPYPRDPHGFGYPHEPPPFGKGHGFHVDTPKQPPLKIPNKKPHMKPHSPSTTKPPNNGGKPTAKFKDQSSLPTSVSTTTISTVPPAVVATTPSIIVTSSLPNVNPSTSTEEPAYDIDLRFGNM